MARRRPAHKRKPSQPVPVTNGAAPKPVLGAAPPPPRHEHFTELELDFFRRGEELSLAAPEEPEG